MIPFAPPPAGGAFFGHAVFCPAVLTHSIRLLTVTAFERLLGYAENFIRPDTGALARAPASRGTLRRRVGGDSRHGAVAHLIATRPTSPNRTRGRSSRWEEGILFASPAPLCAGARAARSRLRSRGRITRNHRGSRKSRTCPPAPPLAPGTVFQPDRRQTGQKLLSRPFLGSHRPPCPATHAQDHDRRSRRRRRARFSTPRPACGQGLVHRQLAADGRGRHRTRRQKRSRQSDLQTGRHRKRAPARWLSRSRDPQPGPAPRAKAGRGRRGGVSHPQARRTTCRARPEGPHV